MRILFFLFFLLCFGISPAYAVMEDYPSIKLQGLDKSVGRTKSFEAKVGDTIQYGSLFVKIHACRKAPPIEKPESAAFLQIWEIPPGEKKSEWVFSGWMFASSPALSAMDHSVYDIWVLDCTGREEPVEEDVAPEEETVTAPVEAKEQEDVPLEDMPVDMEAEPEPEPVEQNAAPMADPTIDPNATAYDFMKQEGTNASPTPVPVAPVQDSPIY